MPRKLKKNKDDWSVIRGHLILASRELLLASKGIIALCKNEGITKGHPEVDRALDKASKLAEEFAKGILNTGSFSEIAKDMLVPIIRSTGPTGKKKTSSSKRRGGRK